MNLLLKVSNFEKWAQAIINALSQVQTKASAGIMFAVQMLYVDVSAVHSCSLICNSWIELFYADNVESVLRVTNYAIEGTAVSQESREVRM